MGKIPEPTTGKAYKYKPLIQEYLDSIPTTNGLYLYGKYYGHGKTSLAAIVLKQFAVKGIYGYWMNYKTILNIEFNPDNSEKNKMWECPVLVVDEFDLVETSVEKSVRKTIEFEALLRYRYGNELPTIITSNLALDDNLIKKFPHAEGIRSVLSDCTTPINVYGKNWRKL